MNIAFNFLVRFRGFFFTRNGTKSLICYFYIMPQTGYAMFTLYLHQVVILLEMYSVHLANNVKILIH